MSDDAVVRRDGVTRLSGSTRWLSSGFDGGYREAPAAYNVTVPEGFDRTDLARYGRERRERARFGEGPTLLTGVSQDHARCGRAGPVTVVATAGVSNPAALPMDPDGVKGMDPDGAEKAERPDDWRPGTVNLLVAVDRALDDGALASLHGVVVEAKAATLLAEVGFPGTTSDAVVVGCDERGEPEPFAGSATEVGDAARACVREVVAASLASRYAESDPPGSVPGARYGVSTERRAEVSGLRTDTKD